MNLTLAVIESLGCAVIAGALVYRTLHHFGSGGGHSQDDGRR